MATRMDRRRTGIAAALSALLIALAGCEDATAPSADELSADVAAARAQWLASPRSDYTFEGRIVTVFFPPGPFARVTVSSGQVVSVVELPSGRALERAPFTLAELWSMIDAGEDLPIGDNRHASRMRFDATGAPRQVMIGSFANDGGRLHEVRLLQVR